jgi:hypothetical protein
VPMVTFAALVVVANDTNAINDIGQAVFKSVP